MCRQMALFGLQTLEESADLFLRLDLDAIDNRYQDITGDGDEVRQISGDGVVHERPLAAGLKIGIEDVGLAG